MDTQPEAWRAGALTALTQALVRLEALEPQAPPSLVDAPELLEENRFRAARDGVRAELLDPVRRRSAPVADARRARRRGLPRPCPRPRVRGELDRVAAIVEAPADELQRDLAGPGEDLQAVRPASASGSGS